MLYEIVKAKMSAMTTQQYDYLCTKCPGLPPANGEPEDGVEVYEAVVAIEKEGRSGQLLMCLEEVQALSNLMASFVLLGSNPKTSAPAKPIV